jgi:hypothetical protein
MTLPRAGFPKIVKALHLLLRSCLPSCRGGVRSAQPALAFSEWRDTDGAA